jgi:predicted O-methyltransferase YrrM
MDRADELTALYERHAGDLRRVRAEQGELYRERGYSRWERLFAYRWMRTTARRAGIDWERRRWMNPMLDDVEAELTYLLIRDRRPESVVEISPFRGWSTTWILRALRDNDKGTLVSFDLIEHARRFVPAELAEPWVLITGDVRDKAPDIPDQIDYLFLDSDHRRAFAEWYLAELVPHLAPDAMVSVHDVFHGRGPSRGSGEARVVLDWLDRWRLDWFTASRFGPGPLHEAIHDVRTRLGLTEPIHSGDHDSMIFFAVPARSGARARSIYD